VPGRQREVPATQDSLHISREEFKAIVRGLRRMRGWTQKQLAAAAGVSTGTIQQYEAGRKNPQFKSVESVLGGFGLDVSDLPQLRAFFRWLTARMAGGDLAYSSELAERAAVISDSELPTRDNRQRAAELGRAVAEIIEPILDYVRARPP